MSADQQAFGLFMVLFLAILCVSFATVGAARWLGLMLRRWWRESRWHRQARDEWGRRHADD